MSDSETAVPWQDPIPEETKLCTFSDFEKVKMVTAEVVSAEAHPKADRLLVLQLKIGEKTKQIVAGIREHYSATPVAPPVAAEADQPKPCIVGKTIIVVDNLEPRPMRGVDSNGMLLAVRT